MTTKPRNEHPLHYHTDQEKRLYPWTQDTLRAHLKYVHGVTESADATLPRLIFVHDGLSHSTSARLADERPPAPAGRDEYLTRLDAHIRLVHGQSWNDEAGRAATLGGLVAARNMYARPDRLRYMFADGLREALAGPLLDEDQPLFQPPLLSAAGHDERLDGGWATWEGGREFVLAGWAGIKAGRTEHCHAHAGGPFFNHEHPAGDVPHDHEPGDPLISKNAVAQLKASRG